LEENWILVESRYEKSGIGRALFISILLVLLSQEFDLVLIAYLLSRETFWVAAQRIRSSRPQEVLEVESQDWRRLP
jgi:hypothetical protein